MGGWTIGKPVAGRRPTPQYPPGKEVVITMKTLHIAAAVAIVGANLQAQRPSMQHRLAEPWRGDIVLAAHATTPQTASVSVSFWVDDVWIASGGGEFVLQLEPGLDGIKAHIGYGGRYWIVAGAFKTSVLYTWSNPIDADPDQLYVGGEIELAFGYAIGSIGVYTHVHGDDRDHSTIVSTAIGLGF